MLEGKARADEGDARAYLLALASGLMDEARKELRDPEAATILERGERAIRDIESADLRSFGMWQRSAHAYDALADMVAAARNGRARVARSYESMDDLWRDAEAQAQGKSPHTSWDTWEHGRRRQIEGALAAKLGAESALLLTSGMSAIAAAVGALRLARGGTVLTGRRGASETTDYLNRYVGPLGVKIARVPPGHADAVLGALVTTRPQLALFETAVSAPGGDVPSNVTRWFDSAPDTLFVIDNTVQSVLTRWFDGRSAGNVAVLENAPFYLAHGCVAGVLYGPEAVVSPLRDYARVTGMNLQEKAFNFIRPVEIEHLDWKLRRHATNVCAFVSELENAGYVDVHTLDSAADPEAKRTLFGNGSGCLVFVRLRGPGEREGAHRHLLARWQSFAQRHGAWVPVRAGFGWSDTTARLYEPVRRSPADAQMHLRISVGIEPEQTVRKLARALAEACSEVEVGVV